MIERRRFDVIVIGSGCAASILARVLRRQGRSVLMVERSAHPRFAIGESSTPLANFCLERLAETWGLPDLFQLAAYGRWSGSHPELRRGLKRGFTFYRHAVGERFENGRRNESRLLVAASPDDRSADAHWLRSDIDHYLVRQAVEEGVELSERTEAGDLEIDDRGVRLRITTKKETGVVEARDVEGDLLVDGSGAGGFLASRLGIPEAARPAEFSTRLVFGHFTNVGSFVEVAREGGAAMPAGPYPDERAAVHHILDGGWMYVLPFDHGVVSAGFLIREDRPGRLDEVSRGLAADDAWRAMLALYPSLRSQFGEAIALRPIEETGPVPRKLREASGERWAMLPHTFSFLDPIFSTGLAWSLQGVEKLAEGLRPWDPRASGGDATLVGALERYGEMLERESGQLRRLIDGAYLAMADFDLLVQQSFLYFAAVSFVESRLRLAGPSPGSVPMIDEGFLGAGDPEMERVFSAALRRLRSHDGQGSAAGSRETDDFASWVRAAIAPWNVSGLADPEANNLYPVDLELLVEHADLLGMEPNRVREALPRLRRA